MKNGKTLWIAITVVIVAVVVGILILYKNQIRSTKLLLPENWTVFKNDTYSYKIAHPKSWPANVKSPENVSLGLVSWEPTPPMFIFVYPNKKFFYLEEFKQGYPEGCKDVETKMITNLNTLKLVCIVYAGQETNEYFFERGQNLYHISFLSGQANLNAIFEKMIQTFDFE